MDVILYESGSGGELNIKGRDIETGSGFFNQVYLALFGGNPEQSTEPDIDTPRYDYWGNFLFDRPQQFNSETEKALNTNALNSAGRKDIEQAVKKDLELLGLDYSLSVLVGHDRIEINVDFEEGREFRFIWDAARRELIETKTL